MSDLLPVFQQKDVEDRFIKSVMPLYRGDAQRAQIQLESQKIEFTRAITGLKNWQNIPQGEIERVLYASAATGLTWAATERNFYLIPRGGYIPDGKGGKVWSNEATLEMKVTADGETNLRIAEGQFKRLRGPFCVYEGDVWSHDPSGNKCRHEPKPDDQVDGSERVIACYLFVVENDGTETLTVLDKRDILRLIGFSRKQNTPKDAAKVVAGKEYANELYFAYNGWIDPGFAGTKCRYRAFKGRPKCKNMKDLQVYGQLEDETATPQAQQPEGTITITEPGMPSGAIDVPHQDVSSEFDGM